MKTIFSILFFVSFFTGIAFAQTEEMIKFDEPQHDFAKIKEEGGPATHVFTFTNTSKTAIKLTSVKASCGCTTPKWTSEVVEPGKKGTIEATYNPMGRPGPFTKSVTVKYDVATPAEGSEGKTIMLTIKGEVIPKPAEATPAEAAPSGK